MRTITKQYNIYQYKELDDNAKQTAKYEYIDQYRDASDMYNNFKFYLSNFTNSDLDVQFDFGCSQGDGVNIFGEFNVIEDWLPLWNATEDEKQTVHSWFDKNDVEYYNLMKNDRHTSTKKLSEKIFGIDAFTNDNNVKKCLCDLIDTLADYEKSFLAEGMEYFLELDDNEPDEFGVWFDEKGHIVEVDE